MREKSPIIVVAVITVRATTIVPLSILRTEEMRGQGYRRVRVVSVTITEKRKKRLEKVMVLRDAV